MHLKHNCLSHEKVLCRKGVSVPFDPYVPRGLDFSLSLSIFSLWPDPCQYPPERAGKRFRKSLRGPENESTNVAGLGRENISVGSV